MNRIRIRHLTDEFCPVNQRRRMIITGVLTIDDRPTWENLQYRIPLGS